MNVIERINLLKKIVKEAERIVNWQEDIYTALHNIDAAWVVSGILALARIPNIDWGRISANFPRTIADILSDHDLAHHPLVIIPVMDWAHISGLFPRTIADLLSNHNLANHPLAIIPVMDWAHISGLFPRTIADILSDHDLANHPLAIIPNMDWAHISGLFPRTIAALLSDHDLAHHPLAIIPVMDDGHIPDLETLSYGGAFAVAQIPALPASQITSGQFPLSRMPRAASGLFLEGNGAADPIYNALIAADIPNLDAAKIVSGIFPVARGGTGLSTIALGGILYASALDVLSRLAPTAANHVLRSTAANALQFAALLAADIPNLDAAKITSGAFALARIPNMDWAHVSGLFPRTIADILSDHDLANHPLAIIPNMDWAHISGLFPRTIAALLSDHDLAHHGLGVIVPHDALASLTEKAHASLTGVGIDDHHARDHAARHEPGGANAMTVDAAAATGSLRTLGTGAQQAAPGNHSHTVVFTEGFHATDYQETAHDWTDLASGTAPANARQVVLVCGVFGRYWDGAAYCRCLYNNVEKCSCSVGFAGQHASNDWIGAGIGSAATIKAQRKLTEQPTYQFQAFFHGYGGWDTI